MSSKFANRRKPRKVGGDDEEGEEEQGKSCLDHLRATT